MRYKFRAWLKDEKKMVEVSELRNIDTDIKSDENIVYFDFEKQEYCCKGFDEVELMLGLEIYDKETTVFIGDIIRVYGGEYMFGYYEVDETIHINDLEDLVSLFNMDCGIDILGNIYENKELLNNE